jgi:hypothetical protein
MPLNRRHFLFGALAAPVLAATKKHAAVERPNIVLIVAEELGAYMARVLWECGGAHAEYRPAGADRRALS